MEQINKLKKEIGDLENSVDESMSKEELYDILVVAFFKAKDIIEMYDDVNPIIEKPQENNEEELLGEIVKLKGDLQEALKETSDQRELAEELTDRNTLLANTLSNIDKELAKVN